MKRIFILIGLVVSIPLIIFGIFFFVKGGSLSVPMQKDSQTPTSTETGIDLDKHYENLNNQTATIFSIGGQIKDPQTQRSTATNSAEYYNFKSDKWSEMPSMSKPRYGAAVAVLANKIYVFGGLDGQIGSPTITSVEVFDLITNEWSFVKEMPHSRGYSQALVASGKIYLLGGFNERNSQDNSVDVYNPTTDSWERAADIQQGFYSPHCGAIADKIYCPGLGEYSYTLVYDTKGNAWSSLPTQNRKLFGSTINWASLGSKLYGVDLLNSNDILIYDSSIDTITTKPGGNYIHPSYQGFTMLSLNNNLFLVGGEFTGGPVKDFYRFNLSTSKSWEKKTNMQTARSQVGVVIVPTNYTGAKAEGGSISGIVTKDGVPVAGRDVVLIENFPLGTPTYDREFLTTQTDGSGRYVFSSLNPGNYQVLIGKNYGGTIRGYSPFYKENNKFVTLEKNQQIQDYNCSLKTAVNEVEECSEGGHGGEVVF